MKTLLPLLSALALSLLAACSPEPPAQETPKAAETPPAGEQSRQDAKEASREAVDAAREAAGKAGEAAKKFGEAGAAAVQAVVESTEEKVREGVEAAGGEATVRDAKEAAEHAAQRIADATRDAAQRLKEVGKGAIESVRPKPEVAADEAAVETEQLPAPVEERSPSNPVEGESTR
ncbi:hypothetical protein [Thauera sp.]|jgi:hypothetical protein|uniref:hypothetical protein n=1 Tax=Thauera sp. TaxID=1905334 RepID=UPI002A3635AB|nr:hypothetical protein [Thauera sp.]MDX9886816.1 hypothetical protein [Thauera sp.]